MITAARHGTVSLSLVVGGRKRRGAADVPMSAPNGGADIGKSAGVGYRFARCRSSRSTSKVNDSGTDTGS